MKIIEIVKNYNTDNCDIVYGQYAKSEYHGLLRFRKKYPDGKKLNIKKKKYDEKEEKWTLFLDGKEYVAKAVDGEFEFKYMLKEALYAEERNKALKKGGN